MRAGQRSTVTTGIFGVQVGTGFSDGGHFAEHGVDEQCDPGKTLGPLFVPQGGRLRARVVGNPPVPNRWSLHNYNTGVMIEYEPLLGKSYAPGKIVLELAGQGENNDVSGEGQWDGPGRLWVHISPPWGIGPLSSSCFEQDYQVSVEIIELFPYMPAQPGLAVLSGDTIATEDGFGSLTLTMDNHGASVWLAPGTAVTMNEADQAIPGTEQVSLWFRPSGVAVPQGEQVAEATIDLGYPQWLRELKRLVEGLSTQNYIMPHGYTEDETDHLWWLNFKEATLLEAYNRIKDQGNPCEAATEFRLFMDSKQGQWTMLNAADRGMDLFSDLAMTWILPNEWNALDHFVRTVLAPLPILGQVANFKNVKDTYERIMKELVYDTASQRAAQSLAVFEKSRGWTAEQVQDRNRSLRDGIEASKRTITEARQKAEDTIRQLNDTYNGLGCETGFDLQGPQAELCLQAKRELEAGSRRARFDYEALFRREMASILTSEAEISDLTTYRLPVAQGDCSSLKRSGPAQSQEEPGFCVPKPAQMILRTGAAQILRSKGFTPLFIYIGDTWIIPKGTEFFVEKLGEDGAVVRVFDGEVEVMAADGRRLTVFAGQEAILPEGSISPLSAEDYHTGFVSGLPLATLPLDDWAPQPYGTRIALFRPPFDPVNKSLAQALAMSDRVLYGRPVLQRALAQVLGRFSPVVGSGLPLDWVWQDTDANHSRYAPGQRAGDATWEVPAPGVLRVTVPNENEMWGARDDAPRLLHKVTGDFDLEAEMLLECAGLHFAISEFVLFAPGFSLGYLGGQFYPEELKSQYLLLGGAWYRYQNLNRLPLANRPLERGVDPGEEPVLVRLSRRGDIVKAYWSRDGGQTWNLSTREELALPETLWVGWLFKRMAWDGLYDQPAVTTLGNIRLKSAPLGSMLDTQWDVASGGGEVIAGETELLMLQDGSQPGYVQAYSPWPIEGDFDLTVRYQASPVDIQPGQERYIHVAVTSNDESNHAYIRNVLTADRHWYNVDMAINGGWYHYREAPTTDESGFLRLVRQNGLFSAYYQQDGEWVRLDEWQESFTDPVYLDLRYEWVSPEPILTQVRFTIERLTAPEGDWIGPGG